MKDFIITELNNTAASLGLENRVRFYGADAVKVACEIAPFGKVAVIYTKISYTDFGKEITQRLKNVGIKPLNFIMPENTVLNLSSVFDIICVPDDVRAVLIFDRELTDIAAYIATLFKIPVILTLNSVNTDGVLPAKVPFFWGGNAPDTDFFAVDCVYHVAIADNVLTCGDKSKQYIDVYGKLLALTDYRVKLALFGGNAYDFARDVIFGAINAVLKSPDSAETLFVSGLKTELADLSVGGAILFNSAEYGFKRLIGFTEEFGVSFAFIKRLIDLYALCVSEKDMPFAVPDYNKRVKELVDVTKSDDGAFLKGFSAQVKAIKGKDLSAVKADFKDDITSLKEEFNVVEENYKKFGGKTDADFSPYIKAFKLCGDLPDTLNFMTIVRESGFTEFI